MTMTEPRESATVTESARVAIVTTFHGQTSHRPNRVSVRRADGGGPRLVISWNHDIGTMANHAAAVMEYVTMMNWGGTWAVGATTTGAVATWAGPAI